MSAIARDLESCPLYIHPSTLSCAVDGQCIPCLYKVSPLGTFGEKKAPPNGRPEECPRSKGDYSNIKTQASDAGYGGLYRDDTYKSILTVGDGDFSFSLSLAKGIAAAGSQCKLVASSHESYESVRKTYSDADATLAELKRLGVQVLHEVDATALHNSPDIGSARFDVIIWNFPCVGVAEKKLGGEHTPVGAQGPDGQAGEVELNKQLMRDFFKNAANNIALNTGEVHIVHKTFEPFSWIDMPAHNEESGGALVLDCRVVFDRILYPGYVNRKVLHRKSFPSHDAQTFIFRTSGGGEATSAAPAEKSSKKGSKKLKKSEIVVKECESEEKKEGVSSTKCLLAQHLVRLVSDDYNRPVLKQLEQASQRALHAANNKVAGKKRKR